MVARFVAIVVVIAGCGSRESQRAELTQAVFDCNASSQRLSCPASPRPNKKFICHASANEYQLIEVSQNSNHYEGVAHGNHALKDAAPGASADENDGMALDCECESRTCTDVCTGAADGVECDDGNACTENGACAGGQCQAGAPSCVADELIDACTRLTGGCDAGVCETAAVACDDGDACTADQCDPSLGCTHEPICEPEPCLETRTLVVDASVNAIRMEGSVAAHVNLSAGIHTVDVSGHANFGGGDWVIARYRRPGGGGFELLEVGTAEIELEQAGPLWAFLFDQWNAITFNDNFGAFTVAVDNSPATTTSVHAVSNTFLLDDTVAARISLPAGTWRVNVTGDASYAPGHPFGSVMVGAYPAFEGLSGGRHMVAMGDELTFTSLGYGGDLEPHNFFAFFADDGDFTDNAGAATFELCKLHD